MDELLKKLLKAALGTLYPTSSVKDWLDFLKKMRNSPKKRMNEIFSRHCTPDNRPFFESEVGRVLAAVPSIDWERNPRLTDPTALYFQLLEVYGRTGGDHVGEREQDTVFAILKEIAQLMTEILLDDEQYQRRASAAALAQGADNGNKLDQILAMLAAKEQAKDGPPPDPTKRQRDAERLIARGRQSEALALLSAPEREDALEDTQRRIEQDLVVIRQHISENRLRIDLLKQQGLNEQTIPEITALYRESVALAKRHKVSLSVLYDFAAFLWPLHGYDEAVGLCRWLLKWYELEGVDEAERASLMNLLGILLMDTFHTEEAEQFYRNSLEIRRKLAESNPSELLPEVAQSCNNLGNLLSMLGRTEEAEQYHQESLDIRLALAKDEPILFSFEVAQSFLNMGNDFSANQKIFDAADCYHRTLTILEYLDESFPRQTKEPMAMAYHSWGNLLFKVGALDQAERFFWSALTIFHKLAQNNPTAFDSCEARCSLSLGKLYYHTKRWDEAENCYRRALDLYRRMAQDERDAFESDVAEACIALGESLVFVHYLGSDEQREHEELALYPQRFDEGVCLIREAAEICRRLSQTCGTIFEPHLAKICSNLGGLLEDGEHNAESEFFRNESLEISRRLANNNPSKYEYDFAHACFNMAGFEYRRGNKQRSKQLYQEALTIYEKSSLHSDDAKMTRLLMKIYD